MAEKRKKLTDLQLKRLIETQSTLAQARAALQKADADAVGVIQLIFDAHDIPQDWLADIDQASGELVCRPPETPAAAAAE